MSDLFSVAINFINKLQSQYYSVPFDDLVALGIVGRLKLYDWSIELLGLGLIAILVFLFAAGASRNESIAKNFISTIKPVLDENFYQVGVSKDQLYIKDSPENFTTYSTGRVNIAGLTVKVDLSSRQNLFFFFTEYIFSLFFDTIPAPEDSVTVIIKPTTDSLIGNYIFAIVNKEGMNKEREENYFLSLTKTSESSELPSEFVYMSESADLNSGLTSESLNKVLAKSGKLLKYLAISDLPTDKPIKVSQAQSKTELVLRIALKNDKNSLQTSKELINEFIELADRASKFELKADQQKKINNVRLAEINKIEKAIKEQREEQLKEEKLEAEKEARRNLQKISPEEQEKLELKQREKRERRAKNKQTKRF